MRALHGVILVLLALAAAGCGSVAAFEEAGSGEDGAQLFKDRCGQCHTLAAAGTNGVIGPDLDEAFDDVRSQGFDESTIRELVRGQIAYPVSDPPTDAPGMPAEDELFAGLEDTDAAADAVAVYVASVAGDPEAAAAAGGDGEQPSDPKELFAANCGACHVLADAGTTGTIGPNLDETRPSVDAAAEQIANGGGGMPAFADTLTEEQIRELAEYVAEVAGG